MQLISMQKMLEVGLIPRYASAVLSDEDSKKRYKNKLQLINGLDPYGWVREVLVKSVNDKRIVIGKVSS